MEIERREAIDLRSDTVTRPTPSMREAMACAEVGDDVFGEDPSINRLEEMAADILGKEAAIYVSSGTMGNLISVLSHCGRGDEMILGDRAHIYLSEQGGTAAVGGVHPRAVPNLSDGTVDLDVVAASIRTDNEHYPITRLIALENTHNVCGGRALPVDYMDAAGALAAENDLSLHIDGARIWNAAVALGVTPARLVKSADSVSACLSKGLAAPVGSVVAGSSDFIRRARRMRKVVGGGMRQAGIIAAAGIVSLTTMIDRLADDHANAQVLAQGLAGIEGIQIKAEEVQTDLVYFEVDRPDMDAAQLSAGLAEKGVLINAVGKNRLRAVTNYHIGSADVEQVLAAIEAVLAEAPVESAAPASAYG